MPYIIAGIIILLLGGIIAMLCFTLPIAKGVYFDQLVKTSPDKWGRVCSAPENEEQLKMWNDGCAWAQSVKDKMQPVHIMHDGLNLYGEYYDFGSDRCVIVLPGRCECLMYSYYFAIPYHKSGLNILVIDSRAHGLSDGKYNTIGLKESEDLKEWMRYIIDNKGIKEIYLHGICIGTSCALFAAASSDCPDRLKGIITEGCFVSFRETFKRHMIYDNKPLFPVLDLCMLYIWKYAGTNVYKYSPINTIGKVKQDMLFLYGTKDVFSIPEKTKILFKKAGSKNKKLVWFDKGAHSHLRINNTEKYDKAIAEFLNK